MKYTYYWIDFHGFNYNGGDYTICSNLTDMFKLLQEIEHVLDEQPEEWEHIKSVSVRGVVMTKLQYAEYLSNLEEEY